MEFRRRLRRMGRDEAVVGIIVPARASWAWLSSLVVHTPFALSALMSIVEALFGVSDG